MPTETIISANIPGHGLYRCTARAFQGTIEKYLPTSPPQARGGSDPQVVCHLSGDTRRPRRKE